jgi:hypothetical protein
MEVRPGSLLQACLLDVRTALHRMGQRVDKLPYSYTPPIGPCFRQDPKGNWVPNNLTLACMRDMQRLEKDHPNATNFDWEMFRLGWQAGAKWCEGNLSLTNTRDESDREENTYTSPVAQL